jgi:hypothetical protein
MKMNILEMVQDILSDMNGDYVESISDTDEATQVAQIIKSTYLAMLSNRNWPHTARLVSLTPFSDLDRPTHMTIDQNIKELISIYYDKIRQGETRINYVQIPYIDPDQFLRFVNRRNNNDVNTKIVTDPSGVKLMIMSNKAPEYFTSFNDNDLVFDSYDVGIDSTLQSSKVQARAYVIPVFEMEDDFIPDLPEEAFSALLEESKSKAMFKLKQMNDIKAEQESGRQQRWLSRKSWRAHEKDIYPFDFGRRPRGGGYRKDPTFRRD